MDVLPIAGAAVLSFALGVLFGGMRMRRRYARLHRLMISPTPTDDFRIELSEAAARVAKGATGHVGHVLGRQTLRRYARIVNGTAREPQDQ
jgi:hypothetical protein